MFCVIPDHQKVCISKLNLLELNFWLTFLGRNKPRENKLCDFCGKAIITFISCPKCLKYMHNACFVIDSKMMKFGCEHPDLPLNTGVSRRFDNFFLKKKTSSFNVSGIRNETSTYPLPNFPKVVLGPSMVLWRK